MKKKNNQILFFFNTLFFIITALVLSNKTFAQGNPEKKRLVSYNSFISQILQSHPVAAQAALLNDMARQQLRLSKGL
jgi:hypothetical protein